MEIYSLLRHECRLDQGPTTTDRRGSGEVFTRQTWYCVTVSLQKKAVGPVEPHIGEAKTLDRLCPMKRRGT
jgi:hypothetical protein